MAGNGAIGGFNPLNDLNLAAKSLPNLLQLAKQTIAAHSDHSGKIDFQGLAKSLAASSPQTSETGPMLRHAVETQLAPLQRGSLLRESDMLAADASKQLASPSLSNIKEITLDPKALGFSKANFANAMDKGHPAETRAKVAQMWSEGKNLPRFIIADLKTANASFDPSAGPNGTITLNAKLLRATDMSAGYGSFAAWGVMEEIGHWADRQAHIISGNAQGQTIGDEGARFAHAMQQTLPEGASGNKMGYVANMTLGTADGKAVRFDYDRVVLKGLDAVLSANGHMSAENKVGNVEMYHPDGHYVGTFLNAMGVGVSLGMKDAQIAPIAAELALGSQLPDMLEQFDALSQFKAKKADEAKEAGRNTAKVMVPLSSPILGNHPYWTKAEQSHLENVYRGLHGMPATEAEATPQYLKQERTKTSAFIESKMKDRDWLSAGVAIHRLADLYAHVQPDGRPYWGDAGHGHEDAKGKIAWDTWGRSPDLLFYKANFDRFEKGYMPALQETLSNGLKNAGLAQEMTPTKGVQAGANAYFRSIMNSADADPRFEVKIATNYSYKHLMKMEQDFVNFVAEAFKGQATVMNHNDANSTGVYPASQKQISKIERVMVDLAKK